jgi:hypothetical protein
VLRRCVRRPNVSRPASSEGRVPVRGSGSSLDLVSYRAAALLSPRDLWSAYAITERHVNKYQQHPHTDQRGEGESVLQRLYLLIPIFR